MWGDNERDLIGSHLSACGHLSLPQSLQICNLTSWLRLPVETPYPISRHIHNCEQHGTAIVWIMMKPLVRLHSCFSFIQIKWNGTVHHFHYIGVFIPPTAHSYQDNAFHRSRGTYVRLRPSQLALQSHQDSQNQRVPIASNCFTI